MPSSSSSGPQKHHEYLITGIMVGPTDVNRPNFDALLLMSSLWTITNFVGDKICVTKGVHKGGSSGSRGT